MGKILNHPIRGRQYFEETHFGTTYQQDLGTKLYAGMPKGLGSVPVGGRPDPTVWVTFEGTTDAFTEPEGEGTYYPTGSFEPSYGTSDDIADSIGGTFIYQAYYKGTDDPGWTLLGEGTKVFPCAVATTAGTIEWLTGSVFAGGKSGTCIGNGTNFTLIALDIDTGWITGDWLSSPWSVTWNALISFSMDPYKRDDLPFPQINWQHAGLDGYGNIDIKDPPSSYSGFWRDTTSGVSPGFATVFVVGSVLSFHTGRHLDNAGSFKMNNVSVNVNLPGLGTYGDFSANTSWNISSISYNGISLPPPGTNANISWQDLFDGDSGPYIYRLVGSFLAPSIPNQATWAATTFGSGTGYITMY